MPIRKRRSRSGSRNGENGNGHGNGNGTGRGMPVSSSIEQLLLNALERGDESLQTGRYLMTFREGADAEGPRSLAERGMRIADARDFAKHAVTPEDVGDADALVFPEIGVALVSGPAVEARGLALQEEGAAEGPIEVIEPEYFMFAENSDYMRGFARAVQTITKDLGPGSSSPEELEEEVEPEALGATWGLGACRVPMSARSGAGIKIAILDTGIDLGHPDFAGRSITSRTFVGQPVQDLHGHGTHCAGTAAGTRTPPGATPRYGIAHAAKLFIGKVLTNSGSGTTASVLAGINWAIANNCHVISMSLGSRSPVQAAYTKAGTVALAKGLLIVAAAGNNYGQPTGAPANSPTIMAVASLDQSLTPSSFSNKGKIEIAGPGRDVFSSWPRPTRYRTISGTSMATPHVAGCAALWAQMAPAMRGILLWRRLQTSARKLPYPRAAVGSGLVQAP
jgi:subtilisin family serine protease